MKKVIDKGLALVVIVLFGCSYSTELLADEDIDDFFSMSPAELANMPVSIATGTRKPAYLSASVTTVITARQIDTMGATELSQVLETVPGLHVAIQAVTNDPVYSMRGMKNGVNAQVLVLLNGTRFSVPYKGSTMTGMRLPIEAIQKIEVIRGPGSALYGADAFAGVINIITKKAKDIDGTVIGIRGGSWDTQSVWGQHSQQLLGWDIATTLQYQHNNNDDDRVINSDFQSQFDSQFATNASLAPNEMQTKQQRWDAHVNLQRKYWDLGFGAFNQIDGGLRAGAGGSLDDQGKLNSEIYLTDLRFSSEDLIEDWELLAHSSYLYSNIDTTLHNFPEGTVLPINGAGNIGPGKLVRFPDGVITQLGIENQVATFDASSIFKGFTDHLLRLTAGFRYEQVRPQERRNFGKGILDGTQAVVDGQLTNVTGTDLIFLPDSQRTIWSLALQDEWQMSQDWQLTAGIRYDEYSDFGSTFNPRAALVWNVNGQLSTKLMYGQAFRAPSFLEQKQQNSPLFIGDPSLVPETIETTELAFDYRPLSNLRLLSNFYFYQIKNLIAVSTSTGGTVPMVQNSAGQTGFGTEFEWDWQFHEQWNLKGNYAWQYARNEQTKARVSGVPEHQLYVAAAWQFLAKWQLQTQLNWVGNRLNLEGSSNSKLKDYETIDITLNSQRFFGYVDFTASVRNVLDTHGKEPALNSYPDNLPIASRNFYLETTVYF